MRSTAMILPGCTTTITRTARRMALHPLAKTGDYRSPYVASACIPHVASACTPHVASACWQPHHQPISTKGSLP